MKSVLLLLLLLLIAVVYAGNHASHRFCNTPTGCRGNGATVLANPPQGENVEVENIPKTGSLVFENNRCVTSCEWFRNATNIRGNARNAGQYCQECSKRFIIYDSEDTGLDRCYDFSKDMNNKVFTIEFLNKMKDECDSNTGGDCHCQEDPITSFNIDLLIVNVRKIAEESIANATAIVIKRQQSIIDEANRTLREIKASVEKKKQDIKTRIGETIAKVVRRLTGFVTRITAISKRIVRKVRRRRRRRRASRAWAKKIGGFRKKVNNAIEERRERINAFADEKIAKVQRQSQRILANIMEQYNKIKAEVEAFFAQYQESVNEQLQNQIANIKAQSDELKSSTDKTQQRVNRLQDLDGYRNFFNAQFEDFRRSINQRTKALAGAVAAETHIHVNRIMRNARTERSFEELIADLERLDRQLDEEARRMERSKRNGKPKRRGRRGSRRGAAKGVISKGRGIARRIGGAFRRVGRRVGRAVRGIARGAKAVKRVAKGAKRVFRGLSRRRGRGKARKVSHVAPRPHVAPVTHVRPKQVFARVHKTAKRAVHRAVRRFRRR